MSPRPLLLERPRRSHQLWLAFRRINVRGRHIVTLENPDLGIRKELRITVDAGAVVTRAVNLVE